jgi:hypothetical protein
LGTFEGISSQRGNVVLVQLKSLQFGGAQECVASDLLDVSVTEIHEFA